MPLRGRLSREKNTSKGSWGLPSGRLSIGCDLCDLLSLAMGMGTTVVAPVQRQFFTTFCSLCHTSKISHFCLQWTGCHPDWIWNCEAFFLKMEANFTLGLDTKTFFWETQIRYLLINNESKVEKKQSRNLSKLTVEWQSKLNILKPYSRHNWIFKCFVYFDIQLNLLIC